MSACLDDNLIAAYVGGQLPASERGAVVAHLDGCATCLTVMCEAARAIETKPETETEPEPESIGRGATVGRYVILEMIGRGGMGAVYLARDPTLDRRVAVKVVRAADRSVRLADEARAMAKVAHPNVVAVYDSGELADGVFIAMELIDGDTLTAWQAGRTWREIVKVYLDVGRGLAAAHEAHVVHRDFKPDNVLIAPGGRAAVTDFGIALGAAGTDDPVEAVDGEDADRALEVTRTGVLVGTPRYMSPEQFAGTTPDARSDQFSFAVALWEAVFREHPFAGATVGELRAEVMRGARRPPPPGTAVPARVTAVLARALAVAPDARFPTMPALLDALERAAARRRPRRAVRFAAGVVLAGAASVVFAVTRGHETAAPAAPPPAAQNGAHTAVVIAPFANTTGDQRLDDVLDPTVAEVLARSELLDPIAALDLQRAAKAVEMAPTDVDLLAAKIAERQHRRVVVARGSIAHDSDGFRIKLAEPTSGFAAEECVGDLAQVLPAGARLAVQLRSALGDAPEGDVPPLVSTSVDAVHAATQASQLAMTGDLAGAAAGLRHALELDPGDINARITLGLVLYNLSAQPQALAELERAVAGAERLPERTRLLLLGDYYGTQGKYAEAISAYQRYIARWPGDQRTEINLVAIAIDAGDFALAYELSQRVVADHADVPVARGNYVLAEVATGRLDAAERDGAALRRDFPHPPTFPLAATAIAEELLGHTDGAAHTLDALAAIDPEVADQTRADFAMYQGRLADAKALLAPYAERAIAAGKPLDAQNELLVLGEIAVREGDRAAGARYAAQASNTGAPRAEYLAARLAIDAGAVDTVAANVAAWDANPGPEWHMFARLLAGDLALARGDVATAVTAYREATRLGTSWVARARLGLGSLAAGDRGGAARELEWCVEHRGEAALFMTPTLHLLAEVEAGLAKARAP